jgi:hypothetical protein
MPLYKKPSLKVEIDFTGVPTAGYANIQEGDSDAVSFWRMNSTSTMVDEKGVQNGTLVSTPSTTAGPYTFDTDVGILFDGTNDAAYVPYNAQHAASAFTIEGWLKVDSLPAGNRDIIAKRGSWLLHLTTTGTLLFFTQSDVTAAGATTAPLTQDVWYHVACTFDGATCRVYLNGQLAASGAGPTMLNPTPGQPIRFYEPQVNTWGLASASNVSGINAAPTITKPAVNTGDLLVVYLHAGSGTSTVPVFTGEPTGWTRMSASSRSGANATAAGVWVKTMDGTEGASFAWALNVSCTWTGVITRVTGLDVAQPVMAGYAATAVTSNTLNTGAHNSMDLAGALAFFSIEDTPGVAGALSISSGNKYAESGTGSNSHAALWEVVNGVSSWTGTYASSDHMHAHSLFLVQGPARSNVAWKDVSYWNRVMTNTEIAQHYASRVAGAGTWVDVSNDVRQVQIRGGRQYELDRMEARSASIVLQDELRKYDPANQASPYWPNVVPMKRIRVSLIHSAVTYPIFTGLVERWPPEAIGPRYQEVQVSAVDGFDGLSRASVDGSLDTTFSGSQINAILNKAYWPETSRNLDTGQYVMLGDSSLNTTALQAIQDIADSELGVFFIDGEGDAVFHDRAHRGTNSRSTTSQVSFVEASNSTVTYHQLTPSFDRDRIINNWEISPHAELPGGAVQSVTDADSVARYFLRTGARSTKLSSNADALAQANQLLNETAQPALRFDTLVVVPYTDAQWAALLPLQISDRVTVTRNPVPSAGGTTIVRSCFIEGMSWTITPSQIQLALQLSPISNGDYYHTIVRDGPVSYWRMDTVT